MKLRRIILVVLLSYVSPMVADKPQSVRVSEFKQEFRPEGVSAPRFNVAEPSFKSVPAEPARKQTSEPTNKKFQETEPSTKKSSATGKQEVGPTKQQTIQKIEGHWEQVQKGEKQLLDAMVKLRNDAEVIFERAAKNPRDAKTQQALTVLLEKYQGLENQKNDLETLRGGVIYGLLSNDRQHPILMDLKNNIGNENQDAIARELRELRTTVKDSVESLKENFEFQKERAQKEEERIQRERATKKQEKKTEIAALNKDIAKVSDQAKIFRAQLDMLRGRKPTPNEQATIAKSAFDLFENIAAIRKNKRTTATGYTPEMRLLDKAEMDIMNAVGMHGDKIRAASYKNARHIPVDVKDLQYSSRLADLMGVTTPGEKPKEFSKSYLDDPKDILAARVLPRNTFYSNAKKERDAAAQDVQKKAEALERTLQELYSLPQEQFHSTAKAGTTKGATLLPGVAGLFKSRFDELEENAAKQYASFLESTMVLARKEGVRRVALQMLNDKDPKGAAMRNKKELESDKAPLEALTIVRGAQTVLQKFKNDTKGAVDPLRFVSPQVY